MVSGRCGSRVMVGYVCASITILSPPVISCQTDSGSPVSSWGREAQTVALWELSGVGIFCGVIYIGC